MLVEILSLHAPESSDMSLGKRAVRAYQSKEGAHRQWVLE
jgi:hypothetical protein